MKTFFMQKYGSKWPFANESIQQKAKNTIIKKYGDTRKDILKKTTTTNLQKYGVEFPLQHNQIYKKTKTTMLLRYGVNNISREHISKEHLDTLLNETAFKKTIDGKTFREIKQILPVDWSTIAHYCWKYNCSDLIVPSNGSKLEEQIKTFCNKHNIAYY